MTSAPVASAATAVRRLVSPRENKTHLPEVPQKHLARTRRRARQRSRHALPTRRAPLTRAAGRRVPDRRTGHARDPRQGTECAIGYVVA